MKKIIITNVTAALITFVFAMVIIVAITVVFELGQSRAVGAGIFAILGVTVAAVVDTIRDIRKRTEKAPELEQ